MTRAPQTPTEEPGDLAAEYALGVLDREAHRAAEARAQADPAFAAEASAWSERLSPLLDEITPQTPSAGLWPRIFRRLSEPAGSVVPTPISGHRAPSGADELRRKLAVWRAIALTAIAASLALVIALGLNLSKPASKPPPTMLVAELKLEQGAAPLLAAYDPLRRAVLISLAGSTTPSGRSPQLWLIDPAGAPHSLGLLNARGVASVVLPADLAAQLQPAATLAISIEPLGGSLTGLPTGPVIAKGALAPV